LGRPNVLILAELCSLNAINDLLDLTHVFLDLPHYSNDRAVSSVSTPLRSSVTAQEERTFASSDQSREKDLLPCCSVIPHGCLCHTFGRRLAPEHGGGYGHRGNTHVREAAKMTTANELPFRCHAGYLLSLRVAQAGTISKRSRVCA
jgi:hypothetical protein